MIRKRHSYLIICYSVPREYNFDFLLSLPSMLHNYNTYYYFCWLSMNCSMEFLDFTFLPVLLYDLDRRSPHVNTFRLAESIWYECKDLLHTPFTAVKCCQERGMTALETSGANSHNRGGKERGHGGTWMHCQAALLSASPPPVKLWYKSGTRRAAVIRFGVVREEGSLAIVRLKYAFQSGTSH